MASDIFIKIDGVEGESTDANHKGEIEVLSYSHSVTQQASATASSSGGGTAGRCNHADLSITKEMDTASPLLAQRCCEGKHIDSIIVTLNRAGGDKLPYMIYKMSDVVVSSVSVGGGNGAIPTETVTFNYAQIEWEYTQQKRTGGLGGGKTTGSWDLAKNQV